MKFFTFKYGRNLGLILSLLAWQGVATGTLHAQTSNAAPVDLSPSTPSATTNASPADTDALPTLNPAPAVASAPLPPVATPSPALTEPTPTAVSTPLPTIPVEVPATWVLASLLTLMSLVGFLCYQCGLTRAKNVGHTASLLLVGPVFALLGYWISGFAVQTGGIGDAHAALAKPLLAGGSTLDHELGFLAGGHHWGFMGSSSFFLATVPGSANGIAALFLSQAALLLIAVAAMLGAGLERGKLVALGIGAFVIGALIYPLFANWVWGGGWLAETGRELSLGHGFVDLAGAGVVHETAGTLALVTAMVLRPRYGRFGRDKIARAIPGHHLPFVILGALILLVSWMAANAFLTDGNASALTTSNAGVAATNTLLAASGGLLISFLLASARKQRPEPALLCRGLLGGAVASSACSALIDPWAAFVIGGLAGFFVQGAMVWLKKRRIDDPVGATAVHGVGGAWGVLAAGLFANGTAGHGYNGVSGPITGLFFGGGWSQLAAQVIGSATCFIVVFALGYACFTLIHKILGLRVDVVAEAEGLDWTQIGGLGYQADVEPEESK